ncbi:MAG TPA: D-glycero-beta-D-manno-heptose 1-phosphate adenylyltransferase [Elusimicrobiales bacterium]|nr:D-glycero-beta-D-manno-heptose 1-phosphate adenylyltransferase [Elusimicrobiales bacterium]
MMKSVKSKIITLAKATAWRNTQKRLGKKVVFTNGCFDVIHSGHVTLLEKARKLGDFLVIGLNSDTSVKSIKGKDRPINKQSDRALVLAAMSAVDIVVIFNEDTPYNLLKKLQPDILVKGADYKTNQVIGREFAKKVVTVPLVKGKSTSKTISILKHSC